MNGFLKDITYARSGEYILSIYTRESCKDLWKNFGERPITFSIAKKADPRGLRANSYAWALIEQLAAKLKTDKESVYEEMIRRYGVGESYIDEAGNECKVLFSLRDGVPPRARGQTLCRDRHRLHRGQEIHPLPRPERHERVHSRRDGCFPRWHHRRV